MQRDKRVAITLPSPIYVHSIPRRITSVTSVKATNSSKIIGWVARCYGNDAGDTSKPLCASRTFDTAHHADAVKWALHLHNCYGKDRAHV